MVFWTTAFTHDMPLQSMLQDGSVLIFVFLPS